MKKILAFSTGEIFESYRQGYVDTANVRHCGLVAGTAKVIADIIAPFGAFIVLWEKIQRVFKKEVQHAAGS